jgi:hypothetical protein
LDRVCDVCDNDESNLLWLNLHDGLLRLDDEREQRRAALVEREQRRAAERAGRDDDGEGELFVLLSQAVRRQTR